MRTVRLAYSRGDLHVNYYGAEYMRRCRFAFVRSPYPTNTEPFHTLQTTGRSVEHVSTNQTAYGEPCAASELCITTEIIIPMILSFDAQGLSQGLQGLLIPATVLSIPQRTYANKIETQGIQSDRSEIIYLHPAERTVHNTTNVP
jgi:hypothetical protein